MKPLMKVKGRVCKQVGEFSIVVAENSDGEHYAVMRGDDEDIIIEGVLLSFMEIKEALEEAGGPS